MLLLIQNWIDRSKEGDSSNVEEQQKEIVEFVEWQEFVNNHLVTGNVKTLVFDTEGTALIVLREDPEHHISNTNC